MKRVSVYQASGADLYLGFHSVPVSYSFDDPFSMDMACEPVVHMLKSVLLGYGSFDLTTLYGVASHNPSDFEQDLDYMRPLHLPYSSRRDNAVYGSLLGDLKLISDRYSDTNPDITRRENGVVHVKLAADVTVTRGQVPRALGDKSSYSAFGSDFGSYSDVGVDTSLGATLLVVPGRGYRVSPTYENLDGFNTYLDLRWPELASLCGRWIRSDAYIPPYTVPLEFFVEENSFTASTGRLSWRGRIKLLDFALSGRYFEFAYGCSITFLPDLGSRSGVSDGDLLPLLGRSFLSYVTWYSNYDWFGTDLSSLVANFKSYDGVVQLREMDTVVLHTRAAGSVPLDVAVRNTRLSIARFHSLVKSDIYNLTPAAAYSTHHAFENFVEVFKTNHLETFSEIARTLKIGVGVKNLLVEIAKGTRLARLLDRGLTLVDALTKLNLLYQFGIVPVLGATDEVNEKFPALWDRLQTQLKERTLYGKFTYELPYGWLTSRTKLRYRFTSSYTANMVLGLGASGFLPSLSNIWETLTLSFVADWFTNLSRRFKDVDTRLLLLTVGSGWCVHSISVDSMYEDIPMSYYQRDYSLYLPPLRESKYDFRAASGPQDLLTAGSLAWTLIRA